MVYVEFLEVLGRIAIEIFIDSEGEELKLVHKVELLLDEILPEVGAKRIQQKV